MGYTHYFNRTVSLSEEQAAQLCEDAAKIVTYWFDHTTNSAEIFAKKEEHSGRWDEWLEDSQNQLKILESADNREEKLVALWKNSNAIFIHPDDEIVPSEGFYFPFDGDSFSFCKTNHAEGFGPLVYGLFYFLKLSGVGRVSSDYQSAETGAGRKLVKAVFPELITVRGSRKRETLV